MTISVKEKSSFEHESTIVFKAFLDREKNSEKTHAKMFRVSVAFNGIIMHLFIYNAI